MIGCDWAIEKQGVATMAPSGREKCVEETPGEMATASTRFSAEFHKREADADEWRR